MLILQAFPGADGACVDSQRLCFRSYFLLQIAQFLRAPTSLCERDFISKYWEFIRIRVNSDCQSHLLQFHKTTLEDLFSASTLIYIKLHFNFIFLCLFPLKYFANCSCYGQQFVFALFFHRQTWEAYLKLRSAHFDM